MNLFNIIKCALFGHVKFDAGTTKMPVYVQSKDLGNQKRSIHFCDRCCYVFIEKSEMTQDELLAEKAFEQQVELVGKALKQHPNWSQMDAKVGMN